MNYTAAVLTAAMVLLGACAPGSQEIADPRLWKTEAGFADVLPNGAHLRMKSSGTTVRIFSLTPLEGQEATQAQAFLEKEIQGKTVTCKWPQGTGIDSNSAAVTPEGEPIANCRTKCPEKQCSLTYKTIAAGYGKLARGPWQQRTKGSALWAPELLRLERHARKTQIGIWDHQQQDESMK